MYTLGDIPRKSALHCPDCWATVYEGVRLTHRALNSRVNRLANSLAAMGLSKGERAAVLAENTHKYLETYFAAAKLGISITPLNTRLSEDEIAHIVADSQSCCIFAGDGYEARSATICRNIPEIRARIAYDGKHPGFADYEELLRGAAEDEPGVQVDENDLAILMYTGGTTGLPKGVMLSHRNIMTGILSAAIGIGFTKEDATCFVLPLFHVSFWPALCLLMVGGKVAINRKPDLKAILNLIEREKCTHINAVPTLYNWLLEVPELNACDLSSLRSITYAGSPMPVDLLKKCIRKFGNILSQAYGMTEALGVTQLSASDHHLEGQESHLLASAGKPVLCADIAVFDEDDAPVKTGEIGEIVVRGKHIMSGYWKNPELTRQALRGGWYHSGDMGYLDEKGYLFLVDRKADMIVTGGENVYPKEVEEVLYEHPAVAMAVVVSAPDRKWGERVQAVVVLKRGYAPAEAELISFCKSRLSGYKCPKGIAFWDALPTTAVGKILRKNVKKIFWEGHSRSIG